jgi:hypothetical protein
MGPPPIRQQIVRAALPARRTPGYRFHPHRESLTTPRTALRDKRRSSNSAALAAWPGFLFPELLRQCTHYPVQRSSRAEASRPMVATGFDDPALIGEDHRLDTVPEAELGEDARHSAGVEALRGERGIRAMGTPAASALSVEPAPPCPTIAAARGMTSARGIQRSTRTEGGARPAPRLPAPHGRRRQRMGKGDHLAELTNTSGSAKQDARGHVPARATRIEPAFRWS